MENQKHGPRSFGGHHKQVPESVIVDRKGRRVGMDDMQASASVAKWADQAGLRGPALLAASGIATALEAAVRLSLDGSHRDAGKKAASCAYVLKRNERVGGLKVRCRDGRERKLQQVVEWYATVHFKIADDIEAKQAAEEIQRQERLELVQTRKRNAELKRQADAAIAKAEVLVAEQNTTKAA